MKWIKIFNLKVIQSENKTILFLNVVQYKFRWISLLPFLKHLKCTFFIATIIFHLGKQHENAERNISQGTESQRKASVLLNIAPLYGSHNEFQQLAAASDMNLEKMHLWCFVGMYFPCFWQRRFFSFLVWKRNCILMSILYNFLEKFSNDCQTLSCRLNKSKINSQARSVCVKSLHPQCRFGPF